MVCLFVIGRLSDTTNKVIGLNHICTVFPEFLYSHSALEAKMSRGESNVISNTTVAISLISCILRMMWVVF